MIICNLAVLLAERNLKITRVSNDTHISRTTLTFLSQNSSKGIQFETMNSLCNYLNIQPEEFFEYVPIDFVSSFTFPDNPCIYDDPELEEYGGPVSAIVIDGFLKCISSGKEETIELSTKITDTDFKIGDKTEYLFNIDTKILNADERKKFDLFGNKLNPTLKTALKKNILMDLKEFLNQPDSLDLICSKFDWKNRDIEKKYSITL